MPRRITDPTLTMHSESTPSREREFIPIEAPTPILEAESFPEEYRQQTKSTLGDLGKVYDYAVSAPIRAGMAEVVKDQDWPVIRGFYGAAKQYFKTPDTAPKWNEIGEISGLSPLSFKEAAMNSGLQGYYPDISPADIGGFVGENVTDPVNMLSAGAGSIASGALATGLALSKKMKKAKKIRAWHGGSDDIMDWSGGPPTRGNLGAGYFTDNQKQGMQYAIGGGPTEQSLPSLMRDVRKKLPDRSPVLTEVELDIKNPLSPNSLDYSDIKKTFTKDELVEMVEHNTQLDAEDIAEKLKLYDMDENYAFIDEPIEDLVYRKFDDFVDEISKNPVPHDDDAMGGNKAMRVLFANDGKYYKEFMKKNKYDGIQLDDAENLGSTYVPLNSSQIKTVKKTKGRVRGESQGPSMSVGDEPWKLGFDDWMKAGKPDAGIGKGVKFPSDANAEKKAINDFIDTFDDPVDAVRRGEIEPVQMPHRDEKFSEWFNNKESGTQPRSATQTNEGVTVFKGTDDEITFGGGMEDARYSIMNGRLLGYPDESIMHYLVQNHVKGGLKHLWEGKKIPKKTFKDFPKLMGLNE